MRRPTETRPQPSHLGEPVTRLLGPQTVRPGRNEAISCEREIVARFVGRCKCSTWLAQISGIAPIRQFEVRHGETSGPRPRWDLVGA